MKHFDRKPWQRPKSDYGLRSGWRRRRKSGQDGMTPVVSVTEVDEGLHDNGDDDQKTKLAWGQDDDHGWGDRSGNKVGINQKDRIVITFDISHYLMMEEEAWMMGMENMIN